MNSSNAFWGGVIASLMTVIVMWILRTTFGLTVSISMLLGSMFMPAGSSAWVLGFFIHLMLGGMIGLIYGWGFERVSQKAGVWAGVGFGLINALVTGLFMGILPAIHPRIPEAMPTPGYFLSNLGMAGVITLFVLHFVYGAIVGGMYGPVASVLEVAQEKSGEPAT